MKKKILFLSLIVLTLILGFSLNNNETFSNFVESKLFYSGEESVELTVGTYTSSDGHTITVGEDNTVKYDDTYTLTATASDRGYVISGKIGTNKKAVTFYQLNDSKIVSGGVVSYTHSGSTVYLYDYTVFSMDVTPVVDENGVIEVYHEDTLVNKYSDLQSAVDGASSGDTIKITSDMDVVGGAYINKDLTIEGNNKTLNAATWANGVFIVESEVTLSINNLTIDGGSTGFEVDYGSVTFTNYTIPLVSGSDTNDIKQNSPIVVSKGTLNIDNVNMNNYYTATAGGAIRVISGSLDVKNSAFNHNRSSNGAAISVGSHFKVNQNEYPVDSVKISFSDFNKNYSGNGAAFYAYNVANVSINDSKFYDNTVTGGYGGAVMFNKQGSNAVSKGLDFIQAKIDNCEFVGNWAGNDGFAIQNYDAELTTTNSLFKKNVGTHPSSSVGTYSMQVSRTEWANESISNSVFEENYGAISGIADHGGHVFLNIDGCKFTKNIGSSTMYFLTSIITVSNCEFVSEVVTNGVIDASSYSETSEYTGTDYTGPRTTVKDCNFSDNGDFDILTRVRGADLKYDLVIEGEVNGNVQVWHGTNLIVEGTLIGDVITDKNTTSDNIKVSDDGKIDGTVSHMSNHYRLTLRYNFGESDQIDGYDVARLFLEENRTYTDKELYMMHFLDKNGMKLEYYTDANFTTLWNYSIAADTTLYAKWVEHEHTYDGTLVLYDNAIHEQCSCGYLGKKLSLSVPSDLYYSGNKIEIVVDNELNLEGYTVSYQVMDKDGNFVDMEGVPTKIGTYKAILTYEDMSISSEYSIIEKPVNPSTGIITPYIICGLIAVVGVVGTILYRKKKFM